MEANVESFPMTDKRILLVTVPDRETGERTAHRLLEKRIAACVQVLPGIESFYHWEGKLERSEELLLIIKTKDSLMAEVEREVRSIHPYKVPQIVAVPILWGHKPYMAWIDESCESFASPSGAKS